VATLRQLLPVAVAFLAACGRDSRCRDDMSVLPWSGGVCTGAVKFAARDTSGLVPSQAEVDRYADRWGRAIDAEPILWNRQPQLHRISQNRIDLTTRNPAVIAAWKVGTVSTGDAAFDAVIAQLQPVTLSRYANDNGNGDFLFTLEAGVLCNEERLQADLVPTRSSLQDPIQYPSDDGTWTWLDDAPADGADTATARIDFTFGWGDCISGCVGFHSVRAIVPPQGPATVYDLGGDPLPDYLHLSPNTRPLPP
jgi:hypothetical protein